MSMNIERTEVLVWPSHCCVETRMKYYCEYSKGSSRNVRDWIMWILLSCQSPFIWLLNRHIAIQYLLSRSSIDYMRSWTGDLFWYTQALELGLTCGVLFLCLCTHGLQAGLFLCRSSNSFTHDEDHIMCLIRQHYEKRLWCTLYRNATHSSFHMAVKNNAIYYIYYIDSFYRK